MNQSDKRCVSNSFDFWSAKSLAISTYPFDRITPLGIWNKNRQIYSTNYLLTETGKLHELYFE